MNMASKPLIIASDYNTQVCRDRDGNWHRASMRRHRKFRYDPFAPGNEYVENPWLLEDQLGELRHIVEHESPSPELVEQRVNLLDTAISALATNPYFCTIYIVRNLWALALRLLWKGHLKQAEIIVDRARFVDRVMCRNPNFDGDLMHAAGTVKMGAGKFEEAGKIFMTGIRHAENTLDEEFGVAFLLAELAASYMGMERYSDAADTYGRADELSPPRADNDDEWEVLHRQNREKLRQLGFTPNPQRRRSWSEVRYLRGRKKKHKEYLARMGREI